VVVASAAVVEAAEAALPARNLAAAVVASMAALV
jgi:hypothetical protein